MTKIKAIGVILVSFTLFACGQMGSLYLPKPEDQTNATAKNKELNQAAATTQATQTANQGAIGATT
ncbi:MAG: LPS translocon maturation chaperone LptM [Francisellaceae bacterium]